jgi:transposase
MGKPLSEDLRSRLVAAVAGGMSRRAAAERFGVSAATAVRWAAAWAATGVTRAKPQGGDTRSRRVEAYAAAILGAVEAEKDITLTELSELLEREHGARFARSTVWRFLDRHGLTFKKNRARRRAGQARRRGTAAGLVRGAA